MVVLVFGSVLAHTISRPTACRVNLDAARFEDGAEESTGECGDKTNLMLPVIREGVPDRPTAQPMPLQEQPAVPRRRPTPRLLEACLYVLPPPRS